jgi:hypothetical protein
MGNKIVHHRLVIPAGTDKAEVHAMKVSHVAEALARPLYGYRMPRADFRAWMEVKGNSFSLRWMTTNYTDIEVNVHNILAEDGRIGFLNRPISRTDWQIAVLEQPWAAAFSENERIANEMTRMRSAVVANSTRRHLAEAGDVRFSPVFQRAVDLDEDHVASYDRTKGRYEQIASEMISEFFKAPIATFRYR